MLHVVKQFLTEDYGVVDDSCIEECLKLSAIVVAKDINIQLLKRTDSSLDVTVLALLFGRRIKYYEKGIMIRLRVIDTFQSQGGFCRLAEYLATRQCDPTSTPFEFLSHLSMLSPIWPNSTQIPTSSLRVTTC